MIGVVLRRSDATQQVVGFVVGEQNGSSTTSEECILQQHGSIVALIHVGCDSLC